MQKRHTEILDRKLEELSKDPTRLKMVQTKIRRCGLFDIPPATDAELRKDLQQNAHPLIRDAMA